jgi:hypothetical protein
LDLVLLFLTLRLTALPVKRIANLIPIVKMLNASGMELNILANALPRVAMMERNTLKITVTKKLENVNTFLNALLLAVILMLIV